MSNPNIIQIKSSAELKSMSYIAEICNIYIECFCGAPYFEEFNENEIENQFLKYADNGILLLWQDTETKKILAFDAAVPLSCDSDVAKIAAEFGFDKSSDWYHADLGVPERYQRQGIATSLVNELISLISANKILARTQKDNIKSKKLHLKVGFKVIDGMFQSVKRKRITGEIKSDNRIFLLYIKENNN